MVRFSCGVVHYLLLRDVYQVNVSPCSALPTMKEKKLWRNWLTASAVRVSTITLFTIRLPFGLVREPNKIFNWTNDSGIIAPLRFQANVLVTSHLIANDQGVLCNGKIQVTWALYQPRHPQRTSWLGQEGIRLRETVSTLIVGEEKSTENFWQH